MSPRILGFLALFLAPLAAGCGISNGLAEPSSRVRVVVTTSIIADLVKNVGGDHVHVTTLMPPGIDPHRYTPRPSDATALANSDVVFFNGLHLEGKMVDILERANLRGRTPVAVSSRLNPEKDLRHAEAGADGPHDPHIWFDVKLWTKCIDPVVETLCEVDPAHARDFRRNADEYRAKLVELDRELHATIATLPKERRILVTSHDAFHYFGAAYGFEVHGLQGISTASEVGIEDRRKLAAFLAQKDIPAVFGETSVPTKGLQSVLDSARASTGKTVTLIGGDDALYSDALGEEGTPGETYIGMCRHNVNIIVKALKP
ncbi:MAG: zinc ABC transporter substrate-binding protein [Gemmataceae bacterium]